MKRTGFFHPSSLVPHPFKPILLGTHHASAPRSNHVPVPVAPRPAQGRRRRRPRRRPPGLATSLTGLAGALLESSPAVAAVCDVARGEKARPFQVHDLPQVALLEQVTKGVFPVKCVGDIPLAVRQALALAVSGEPGPTA